MIHRRLIAGLGAGLVLLASATQSLAHAHLVQAAPAAEAVALVPAQITLKFSEKLEATFSGFDLSSGGAKAPVKVTLAKDGVTLVGAPAKPLTPGAYRVTWHVVSADGHRMTGAYGFTVK